MSQRLTLAIDAMSGDRGPSVVVPAVVELLRDSADVELALVGHPGDIETHLATVPSGERSRIRVVPASEVVTMDEPPAEALRRKRDSSMRVAINLVKSGEARACVSAGNTGALMATARFVLKTLPGVDRPAILSAIPSADGHTHMLDLGANSSATARQLCEFAVMGAVVAHDVHGLAQPRVGLLNIGTEEIKGNDVLRQAHQWLRSSTLNYTGFVEGDQILSGDVDVVVTDGFTGNVALKTIEGVARTLAGIAREEFRRSPANRLMALVASPMLRRLAARVDPRRYNGATLVGLNGVVVKSHGGADSVAFANAVRTAMLEARKGVPTQISELLQAQDFGTEAT
ncbi:MAG: phosphate acyltransferase PlsX [Gammaproteobacteria bacterium]